jgi:hypothetical protein
MKDQVRVLNENLKRESEQANHLNVQNISFKEENHIVKGLYDQTKQALDETKGDQKQLIDNYRMQLDETKTMVDKIKTNKDREFRQLKDRMDEERRRETEKYEFQYDKLRDEITMMQRRLG